MSSDNTWTLAALLRGDLYGILRCPTCGGVMVSADALKDPEFREAVAGEWLGFVQLSHLDPRSKGGATGALECDECNRPRSDSRWDPAEGTEALPVGKKAAYRGWAEALQRAREDLRERRRKALRGE